MKNKSKIKEFIVACHKSVTNNPSRYESWEWENKFIDGLYIALEDARKRDDKKRPFLLGVWDYLMGQYTFYWMYIDRSKDYRKGLQVASELCEEIKYFGEAFGKDSYQLTI